jgi:uncharacterized membrane protein (DUF485 family)
MNDGVSDHSHPHLKKRRNDGLFRVAVWQLLAFLLLIVLIWVNEVYDLAGLWFGMPCRPMSLFRGAVLTIATIVVALITVGHTYLQQKRIIKGLLTVCSNCRKVRVDSEVWEQLDDYITEHSVALISHGLCPQCFDAMQKEIGEIAKH